MVYGKRTEILMRVLRRASAQYAYVQCAGGWAYASDGARAVRVSLPAGRRADGYYLVTGDHISSVASDPRAALLRDITAVWGTNREDDAQYELHPDRALAMVGMPTMLIYDNARGMLLADTEVGDWAHVELGRRVSGCPRLTRQCIVDGHLWSVVLGRGDGGGKVSMRIPQEADAHHPIRLSWYEDTERIHESVECEAIVLEVYRQGGVHEAVAEHDSED